MDHTVVNTLDGLAHQQNAVAEDMANLCDLPLEVLLQVLWFLPIPSIHTIETLSQSWCHFMQAHQRLVYHQAAVSHGYIPEMSTSWEAARLNYADPAIHRAENWRDFCELTRIVCQKARLTVQIGRYLYYLHARWSGKGPITSKVHSVAGNDIRGIKIDERRGLIITSNCSGGIGVYDMYTDAELWTLDAVSLWFTSPASEPLLILPLGTYLALDAYGVR